MHQVRAINQLQGLAWEPGYMRFGRMVLGSGRDAANLTALTCRATRSGSISAQSSFMGKTALAAYFFWLELLPLQGHT